MLEIRWQGAVDTTRTLSGASRQPTESRRARLKTSSFVDLGSTCHTIRCRYCRAASHRNGLAEREVFSTQIFGNHLSPLTRDFRKNVEYTGAQSIPEDLDANRKEDEGRDPHKDAGS